MPVDQLEREKAPHVRPRSTSPPLAPGSPEQLYSPQERKMVEMVRAIPHFNSFTEDIMAGLARLFTLRELEPGTMLFNEGEEGDRFYVVLQGQVVVVDPGPSPGGEVEDPGPVAGGGTGAAAAAGGGAAGGAGGAGAAAGAGAAGAQRSR